MNEAVKSKIEQLRQQTVHMLRMRYRELFGQDSESTSRIHLLRRIAWRLQADEEGELTERARQRAAELIADAELRLNTRRKLQRPAEVKADGHRDRRLPEVGTVLQREFQGRLVSAKVLEAGFEYEGRKYDSLSAVACEVSGTRWNGFAFFRLNKQAKHD